MNRWRYILPAAALALGTILLAFTLASPRPTFLSVSGPYLGQAPPSMRAERFAPDILPRDLHSTPAFAPDGRQVYWKAMDARQNRLSYSRQIGGRWTVPQSVSLGLLPLDADDPVLAADGQTLYFTSWRPRVWHRPWPHKERIWFAERRGGQRLRWGRPTPLSDAVNGMDVHWQFSLAQDGALYFSSQGDIFSASWGSGQHAAPQRLGPAINTSFREGTPFVAPDASYLIFSSNRDDHSYGMEDLYISFRRETIEWSPAENLGPAVNGDAPELCPRVSPDGKYLFFLSGQSGTLDAYWIDARLIEQLKTKGL